MAAAAGKARKGGMTRAAAKRFKAHSAKKAGPKKPKRR